MTVGSVHLTSETDYHSLKCQAITEVSSLSPASHIVVPSFLPWKVLWVRRHNPGKSWPCILVTAVRPAQYNRLGILPSLWCSKKPFTMRAAFSKLTLENTSRLAVLLSLTLGRVLSQSENFCSLDLLSMAIAWEAHFLFLPPLVCPPSGLSYSLEGGHDLEILPGSSILGTSGELCLSNYSWKWDGTEQ